MEKLVMYTPSDTNFDFANASVVTPIVEIRPEHYTQNPYAVAVYLQAQQWQRIRVELEKDS